MEKEIQIKYLTTRLWTHEVGSSVTFLGLIAIYKFGYTTIAFPLILVLYVLGELAFGHWVNKKEKELSL